MAFIYPHTNPPMLIDHVAELANQLGLGERSYAVETLRLGYRQSEAAWLLSLIEEELDLRPNSHDTLYERLTRCRRVAINRVEEEELDYAFPS